jgi:aldehyde:ferredoxin oxidoreductase
MNYVFKNYKTSAKKRNLSFKLLKEDFSRLTKLNCHYCNLTPSTIMKGQDKSRKMNGDYIYNGLDRINSNKGYELDNVVTCCKHCNRLKSDLVSYEEFIEFIKILKLKRGNKIW